MCNSTERRAPRVLPLVYTHTVDLVLAVPITEDTPSGLWIPGPVLREQYTPGTVKSMTNPAAREVEHVDALSATAVGF